MRAEASTNGSYLDCCVLGAFEGAWGLRCAENLAAGHDVFYPCSPRPVAVKNAFSAANLEQQATRVYWNSAITIQGEEPAGSGVGRGKLCQSA